MNLNVVDLQNFRDWKSFASAMKEMFLEETTLSEQLIDEFVAEFQPIYESFQFKFSFAVPQQAYLMMQDEMTRFETQLHEFTTNLILERLKREISIFRQKYQ